MTGVPAARDRIPVERVALVDLLDRLLAGGVVVQGELTLSIADVDLVQVSVRLLITSVEGVLDAATEQPGR